MRTCLMLALLAGPVAQVPSSTQLAPGIEGFEDLRLESAIYGNERVIRVLLPPGYSDPENDRRRYPVFYFTDGIAAFAEGGWDAAGAFSRLRKDGAISSWIVVGIDNGGSTIRPESAHPEADRAGEYLPFMDEAWTEEPRPAPRGDRFPAFLQEEVMPLVEGRFRTLAGAENTGLAGDSYAGLAAVHFVCERPGVIGRLYLQSPSLYVSGARILEAAARTGRWPERIVLSAGTAEGPTAAARQEMVANLRALAGIIRKNDPTAAVDLFVAEGETHDFDAFRGQLPGAIRFLLGPDEGRVERMGQSSIVGKCGPENREHQADHRSCRE